MNGNDDIVGPMIGLVMVMMLMTIFQKSEPSEPPITEYASLEGRVYCSDTGDLLGDVTVTLGSAIYPTQADGYFYFSNVPLGNYTLSASKDGYLAKSEPVSLLISGKTYTKDIILHPDTVIPEKAHLSGTVRDSQTESPILSAVVKLNNDQTSTNTYGGYSFTNKDPGVYTLMVSKAGYVTKSISVTLLVGNNTQDVLLDPENMPVTEIKGFSFVGG